MTDKSAVNATTGDPTSNGLTLSRLAGYYLDCLTYERRPGVSAWARSQYDLDYVELPGNPLNGDELFTRDVPAVAQLEAKVKKDRDKELYVGYLPYHRVWTTQKGTTARRIYPLIVRPARNPELPASFNPEALRFLLGFGTGGSPVEELVDLEEAVGLSGLDVNVDLGEVCRRLKAEHPEWNWVEEPDPANLATPETREEDPSVAGLHEADQVGIYNRAIILIGEAQKFTVGLEYELAELRKPQPAIRGDADPDTAIGDWLSVARGHISSPDAQAPSPTPKIVDEHGEEISAKSTAGKGLNGMLLEPLPLNIEQREAVQKAMTRNLTVITGPPGTGKSQVVSSILLNAAYRGTSVLFASKNNKAVDVVEERVNALGPRPVLLRLGSRDHQSQLSEYLSRLLSLKSTEADEAAYRDATAHHIKLGKEFEALERELSSLVRIRNSADQLERKAEDARDTLTLAAFAAARAFDDDAATRRVLKLSKAAVRADKNQQGAFTRMMWPMLEKRRVEAVQYAAKAIAADAQALTIEAPETPVSADPAAWIDYANQVGDAVAAIPQARTYLEALDKLTAAPATDEISKKRASLLRRIAENSKRVWDNWLRIQPSLLTPVGRKLLGEYQGALNLAAGGGWRAGAKKVIELFPKVSRYLSCWGVTSLSARGRIPLEPGFFDLLVIDEASQCDIASAIPLLHRARRAVIIGDPMQLRHVSTLEARRDEQLLERAKMLDNLDWSYSGRSLFDLAATIGDPEDLVTLRDHHRSHADIIEFSNEQFYGGQLRVATRYETLCRDEGPAVRWIQVSGQAQRAGQGSVHNPAEVAAVVAELERLAQQGYKGTIGAVSPFRPQANRIRDAAYNHEGLKRFLAEADFHVGTAHSFQGDERDLMIFSPVVTDGIARGSLRFLNSNPNLFNVAVTRARAALIVVGDANSEAIKGVTYLAAFRDYAMDVTEQPALLDGLVKADHGPTYPDVANPDQVSEWERLFYRELYQAGIVTSPQVTVENYRLDLAVIDGARRLDIEVDGEHYHRTWSGELARRDQLRNQRLIELGWDVQRFWVYQIRDDLDGSVARVRRWLDKETQRDS